MRHFARGFFQLPAAGACCYLGLLLARVLWEAPRLLMALAPGSEFHGIQVWGLNPRFYVFGPTGLGTLGAAALAALSMVIGLLALRFAPGFSRRFSGWGRLLVWFTVFWLALFVVDAAVYFALYTRGPLRSLLRVVAPPGWAAPAPGILLLLALVPLTFVLLSRVAGDLPPTAQPALWKRGLAVLLWMVLPVVAINLLQRGAPLAFGLSRAGWPFAPSLLALAAAVPVLWKARQATGVFQPGWKGGAGVMLSGVVELQLHSIAEDWVAAGSSLLDARWLEARDAADLGGKLAGFALALLTLSFLSFGAVIARSAALPRALGLLAVIGAIIIAAAFASYAIGPIGGYTSWKIYMVGFVGATASFVLTAGWLTLRGTRQAPSASGAD